MPLPQIVGRDAAAARAREGDGAAARLLAASRSCAAPLFGLEDEQMAAWFATPEAAEAWLAEAFIGLEVERADGETGLVLEPALATAPPPAGATVWVAWDDGADGWAGIAMLREPG